MKVLMFNHTFFTYSETFIYKQVTGVPGDIDVELLAFKIENEKLFPLQNKKHRVDRIANGADKILIAIRKHIFGVSYKLGFFAHRAVKRMLKQTKYDLVHAHFGFNALLIYPLVKLFNIPLVVTFHGVDASPQQLKQKEYKRRLTKMLDYASAIIIVSPHMKKTLELDSYADKVFVIPCGVDPYEFNVSDTSVEKEIITILHSGRLVSKKGVPDLIRVFSLLSHRYRNVRLFVVGDGPELELCEQLADDARTDSIQFFGAKPHEEVKKFMEDADVFVLNSRMGDKGDMEGLPVSLLEAMSMELAVLSSKHAGIPHAVTSDVDGLLIDEKDNIALTMSIEKLVTDAGLRKRLGAAARQTVLSRFTTDETNKRIAEVYKRVIA
jgi:glycosyltransferase involved in cell wall biosynthesis